MTYAEKQCIVINRFKINYNDSHDILAIIEVFVLDVYGIKNVHQGDTVVDIGAGI